MSGRSAPTGQFFPTHVSVSSHEDTSAWMFSYNFVKNVAGKSPRYRMGDGAKEITKAGTEAFGDHGDRLMCWPHAYRNMNDHLAPIRKVDTLLADRVMADIQFLQWSAHNEETFRYAYKLLEDKYLKGDYDVKKAELLSDFFTYFRKQWIDGPVFR